MKHARASGEKGKEMKRPYPKEFKDVVVRPMDKEMAAVIRAVMTHIGLQTVCPLKPCVRAKACATRHVVCYQAVEEHLRPVVLSALAHDWRKRVARGEEMDISPASEGDKRRLLAWEEAEEKRTRGEATEIDPALLYDPDRPRVSSEDESV